MSDIENRPSLREVLCRHQKWKEEDFEIRLWRKVVFRRAQLATFFVRIFQPDAYFAERRLIEQLGNCHDLDEVQNDIDFYNHKYVVTSFFKDALGFRLSGRRMINLARSAFESEKHREYSS